MDGKPLILVVDDAEINRMMLQGLIESLGYDSVSAENGAEALEIIRSNTPDLVLLDIVMPVMDGYEVLKSLKTDSDFRNIPVIVVSSLDEMKSMVRCVELGAEDYLAKPFDATLLRARVNACLEKKSFFDKEQKFKYWLSESYQKLQQVESSRDTLFRMIVHDQNNLLTSLTSQTELLLMDAKRSSEGGHYLDRIACINKTSWQLSDIVKQLLDVARLEDGRMPVHIESVNLSDLVRNVCEPFMLQIEGKGELVFSQADEDVLCMADRDAFNRVLQNLISNAMQHLSEGERAEISVAVQRVGEKVTIHVSDNGPGIPEECQEKIFNKYYQIDPACSKYGGSLGLGLTYCRMAVQLMNGSITASNGEAGGARFTVQLPAA